MEFILVSGDPFYGSSVFQRPPVTLEIPPSRQKKLISRHHAMKNQDFMITLNIFAQKVLKSQEIRKTQHLNTLFEFPF